LIAGTGISEQIGFGPKAFRKLQSCLVAAEAACSRGDFPVVTVEIALAVVEGLATATDTAAVPAELATLVAELPKATKGAAQPVKLRQRALHPKKKKAGQTDKFGLLGIAINGKELLTLAGYVKDASRP
jgi:hypothetical protein